MCVNVIIGECEYQTVAQLRTICPNIVQYDPKLDGPLHEDSCLCQIDLPATARANGYVARDTDDAMDVEFVRGD